MPGLNFKDQGRFWNGMVGDLVALESERSGSRVKVSIATRWVHWSLNCPRYELREPRSDFVVDELLADWRRLGTPPTVVEDEESLREALRVHRGVVAPRVVAQRVLPGIVRAASCVNLASGGMFGFAEVNAVPQSWLRRRPTKRVRSIVLMRDGGCCRECGKPVTMECDPPPVLHHWREWQDGGLTHPDNLVLLCEGCHVGLHRRHRDIRRKHGPAMLPRPRTRDALTWFRANRVVHSWRSGVAAEPA